MEKLEFYLSIATFIIGLIITTLTFLSKLIKSSKGKKKCEQLIQILNKIVPLVKEAETFVHYTGVEKKEFVMTKINQFIIANKYKLNNDLISDKIEELVEMSKSVNSNTKTSNYQELKKLMKKEEI